MALTEAAVEIRPSTVEELQALVGELAAEHWQEVAPNKAVMPLAPDWLRYRALEQHGSLILLAAWVDSLLVGYCVTSISPCIHSVGLLEARNVVLFVAEEHRHRGIGLRMIRATEKAVRDIGGRLLQWHAPARSGLHDVLPAVGYSATDVIYSKEF